MEGLVDAPMNEIEFPEMRENVVASVESLADPDYQRSQWLDRSVLDSLDMAISILYDDTQVLPNPEKSVGVVLRAGEVESFRELDSRLAPMIDDLGDVADEMYLDDPRWSQVVEAARRALADLRAEPR